MPIIQRDRDQRGRIKLLPLIPIDLILIIGHIGLEKILHTGLLGIPQSAVTLVQRKAA